MPAFKRGPKQNEYAKMLSFHLIMILWFSLSFQIAAAHEVWIEPTQWQVPIGRDVKAHILNGQNFVGVDLP